jgi:ABC-type nickel/cobalt efflux system permease component RcnA
MSAVLLTLVICSFGSAFAHPLGNFTINHFSRLEVGSGKITVRYVIDMAEIPAFQELQTLTGGDSLPSKVQLEDFATRASAHHLEGLVVTVDGVRVILKPVSHNVELPPGAGGLPTLRIESEFTGVINAVTNAVVHSVDFEDRNYAERIGWREIVVNQAAGISVFNSSAFGSALTDELKAYPADRLASPLDERRAQFSFTTGEIPKDGGALLTRNGKAVATVLPGDKLMALIAVPSLTTGTALLGCLLALLLGSLHAMSPGHGKTIVGAYLIGARGTARHAAFLGLTVTLTHTMGVFALGIITLLASEYFVPERVYPVLSVFSGVMVAVIGVNLLIRRCRRLFEDSDVDLHEHSHGGATHSHLPPNAAESISWKSLFAIGVSGGILPCPSALVVLLAAISLHRVGYGLLLVLAFSTGLAGALSAVGLTFIYLRRLVRPNKWFGNSGKIERALPTLSALVITCAGIAICYSALTQAGMSFPGLQSIFANSGSSLASAGGFGVLCLGLIYGLKHATEADHIVAVSAIVSEHQQLTHAATVGILWGAGHTLTLLVTGAAMLALRMTIPDVVASWLEFGVALMIIALGALAVKRALQRRVNFHVHKHAHGGEVHSHVHFHDPENQHGGAPDRHSHLIRRVGIKPVIVGAIHGLAGSAALTLLVLTQIKSSLLGLVYLGVFGLGSIIGMLLMSGLVGLPFVVSSRKLAGIHYSLQLLAGALSIVFGIWYAYETGIANGLIRAVAL